MSLWKDQSLIKQIRLGPANFFDFTSLSSAQYILRLESTLSAREYSYTIQEKLVDLQSPVTHIELKFSPVLHSGQDLEVTTTPILFVLLV